MTRILWEDPTDVATRDLFYGPGGAFDAPSTDARFTFVQVDGAAQQVADDDAGRSWGVTLDVNRARAEVAASRLLWAAGYHVNQHYTLRDVDIAGAGGGQFPIVGFRRRRTDVTIVDSWQWDANPFVGMTELDALRALLAALSVWDLDASHNLVARSDDGPTLDRYYVAALDSALGRSGSVAGDRSRGRVADYARQPFGLGVRDGVVRFYLSDPPAPALARVVPDAARAAGRLLRAVSDAQLRDAFRAASFSDDESVMYVKAIRYRVQQLLAPDAVSYGVRQPMLRDAVVESIQSRLAALGIDPGPIDGKFGTRTRNGVRVFQATRGLLENGEVGAETAAALGVTLPTTDT
jgi:hypothetical protein